MQCLEFIYMSHAKNIEMSPPNRIRIIYFHRSKKRRNEFYYTRIQTKIMNAIVFVYDYREMIFLGFSHSITKSFFFHIKNHSNCHGYILCFVYFYGPFDYAIYKFVFVMCIMVTENGNLHGIFLKLKKMFVIRMALRISRYASQ